MYLIISAILAGIFVTNVVLGATGGELFLGDIGEMLTLFAASLAFVIGVLRREAAEKDKEHHEP